jgi:hypothetical protein
VIEGKWNTRALVSGELRQEVTGEVFGPHLRILMRSLTRTRNLVTARFVTNKEGFGQGDTLPQTYSCGAASDRPPVEPGLFPDADHRLPPEWSVWQPPG